MPQYFQRRRLLIGAGSLFLISVSSLARAAVAPSILAIRVWPSAEYTRVTLECNTQVKFNHFTVDNPDRLVVDLEGVEFNSLLGSIAGQILESDPQIKQLRAGRFKPGTVRLVMDLKAKAKPTVFELAPVGNYGHRLVLDVYRNEELDPLMALVEGNEKKVEPLPEESVVEKLTGEPALKRDKPSVDRLITVVLDPGHGGEDPGAIGAGGSYEKDVTLAVAKRLQKSINSIPNMRAILTRDSDYFVPLGVRVQKARRARADLFLSIHADAWVKPDARGSSVFVLSEKGASSAQARILAQKENEADLIGGANLTAKDPFLARTLLELSQSGTITDSLKVGKFLLGELGGINTLHKAHVEQAGFAVLKAPDIPSALIETAFISNPEEERRLNDRDYQDKLASAIANGVDRYFKKNPPRPGSTQI